MNDVDEDHDDLPVLTDVLRLGRDPFDPRRPPSAQVAASADPAVLAPDQLVVGHDAQARLEPYAMPADAVSGVATARDPSTEWLAPLDGSAPGALDVHPFTGHTDRRASVDRTDADASGTRASDAAADDAGTTAASLDTASLDALREQLRASVFADLADRIDSELDARVAHALHSELEVALARLQERLREQLASGLRDVVGRAVDEQIERLRGGAGDPPQG